MEFLSYQRKMLFLRQIFRLAKIKTCANNPWTCTYFLPMQRWSPQMHIKKEPGRGILVRDLHMKTGKKPAFLPQYDRDKVPRNFDLIYLCSVRHWIGMTKVGMGFFTACVYSLSSYHMSQMTLSLETLLTTEGAFVCGVPFFITFLYTGLNILCRNVVMRIYHNPESDQFISVRRTFLGRLRKLTYTVEDISSRKVTKALTSDTWDTATLKIKGISVFLLSSDFISIPFYNLHVHGRSGSRRSLLAKEHFY